MMYELCCELYRNSTLVSLANRAFCSFGRDAPGENLDRWPDDPKDVASTCLAAGEMPKSQKQCLKIVLVPVLRFTQVFFEDTSGFYHVPTLSITECVLP